MYKTNNHAYGKCTVLVRNYEGDGYCAKQMPQIYSGDIDCTADCTSVYGGETTTITDSDHIERGCDSIEAFADLETYEWWYQAIEDYIDVRDVEEEMDEDDPTPEDIERLAKVAMYGEWELVSRHADDLLTTMGYTLNTTGTAYVLVD